MSGLEAFIDTLEKVLGSEMRPACVDTRLYIIALVHPDAREGDKIYYLRGCTTPVILRRISDPEICQYSVIGSAYIDAMQDLGEGVGDTLQEDLMIC